MERFCLPDAAAGPLHAPVFAGFQPIFQVFVPNAAFHAIMTLFWPLPAGILGR